MTLAETYALQCGVELPENPPEFPTLFFPLPEKYVSLSTKSGQIGKDYDHFMLVVKMLFPVLKQHGICILQLGLKDEAQIPGTYKYDLTIRQSAEAIKNSLCHIGIDTMSAHLAGAFKTPLVELFGMTSKDSVRPHYLGKHIFLSGTDNPSYNPNENPKTVNNIEPELVANAVFEMLGLRERVGIKSKFIGPAYYQRGVELIPNFRPDYNQLAKGNLIVRMDQVHNEQILAETIQCRQEAIAIYTNKSFENITFEKVGFLRCYIDENYDKEDLIKISKYPMQKEFIYLGPKEKINELRRDLLSPHDFPPIAPLVVSEEPIKPEDRVSSQKMILSAGAAYCSIYHAKRGIPGMENIPVGDAADNEFREFIPYFHIFST